MQNLKLVVKRLFYVSRLTDVKNKKLRILISVLLANAIVTIDIGIIVIFSSLLANVVDDTNLIVKTVLNLVNDYKFMIPLLVVLRYLIMFADKMNMEILSLQVNENLRFYLLDEIYKKGNYSTADAYYYLNTVSQHVSSFYKALSGFLNNILQIIGYSIFLIYSDIQMVFYFGLGALILILPTKYLLTKGKHYQHLSFTIGKEANLYIQRILDNIFLLKILKTKTNEFAHFRKILDENKDAWIKNNIYGAANSMLPSFGTLFFLACAFAFFDFAKNLTIEFIGVLLRMFQSLGNFNNTLTMVVNSSVHVEELYKLEENKPPTKNDHFLCDLKNKYAVEVSNLNFKYFGSDKEIFTDLNLKIPKNEHTVITGPNGSGKSTLLGLIAGIHIPQNGNVTINTEKIGYVGVTPLIVSGTLKENLIYGNSVKIKDQILIDIVKEFSLFESDKVDLKMKVSTKTLSSGQMQKISFIRALLNKVEILILDESTSNLDKKTKDLIFKLLSLRKITIINSTHNEEDFLFDNHIQVTIDEEKRKLILR
tara:strand:- start:527 stop:2140 length:1614 start_codon:yes stop_codon:yes gene_type:complete